MRESHTHYPPDERAYTAGAGITAWACKQWDCERFSWCGIVSVCLAEKAVPVRRLLCLERKQSKLSIVSCFPLRHADSFVRTLNSTTTLSLTVQKASAVWDVWLSLEIRVFLSTVFFFSRAYSTVCIAQVCYTRIYLLIATDMSYTKKVSVAHLFCTNLCIFLSKRLRESHLLAPSGCRASFMQPLLYESKKYLGVLQHNNWFVCCNLYCTCTCLANKEVGAVSVVL